MIYGIIAEIGNNHYGIMSRAKEMIKAAHESGADYIKLQAIDPETAKGSMTPDFYKKVALKEAEYYELRHYGESIGAKVFFSCFGRVVISEIMKISGSQFRTFSNKDLEVFNNDRTIISIPTVTDAELLRKSEVVNKMNIMYVTEYLPKFNNVDFRQISRYMRALRKPIGYSDHSIGTGNCKVAIADYGCQLIEKHFHIGKPIIHGGIAFRDCIHSCGPKELVDLKNFYEKEFN